MTNDGRGFESIFQVSMLKSHATRDTVRLVSLIIKMSLKKILLWIRLLINLLTKFILNFVNSFSQISYKVTNTT